MLIIHKKIILLFLLFFCFVQFTSAQNSRSATTEETKVILKEINIVAPIIKGFENNDWQSDYEATDPQYFSVQIDPDVVMGTSSYVGGHFTVRNGSDRYNKLIKPYSDSITNNPPDVNNQKQMDEHTKEGAKIEEMINFYVEVEVNAKNLPVKPAKGSKSDLKIPGVYFAYKESNDDDKTLHNVDHGKSAYVLAFGNWSTAKFEDQNYQFHFNHPLGTPYIENIVILIYGAPDKVQDVLHNTDWKKINEGLTL